MNIMLFVPYSPLMYLHCTNKSTPIYCIFPMFLIYFSYISLIFNFCDHDIVFDIDLKTVTNDRLVGFGGNISFVLTHS